MRFLIVLRQVDDDLHHALVPGLPGCRAVGTDRRQALLYARRAIEEHCRVLADAGEPMPEPRTLEQSGAPGTVVEDATWTTLDVPIEHYFE